MKIFFRFQKAFKKETQSAGTNHLSNGLELGPVGDEPEAGSETLPRAEEACSEDPQQHYHTTVPDPQDVHVYHSGCGVYANNAHILRQSNTYLIPDRKTDTYEPDFYEVKQSSVSAGEIQNTLSVKKHGVWTLRVSCSFLTVLGLALVEICADI